MSKLKLAILLIVTSSASLAGNPNLQQDTSCPSKSPADVPACQSQLMKVPNDIWAFRLELTSWMKKCVPAEGARDLVFGNQSVDDIFRRLRDRPEGVMDVKITAKYEPMKFQKDGRTCYGVRSVEFSLPSGVVTEDGPTDVTPVSAHASISDEMIKESAAAARRAISRSTMTPALSRLSGVLIGLEQNGSEFDDRYFPVAPLLHSGNWDPPACFNRYSTSNRYDCLPAAEAVKACTRNLAVELVTSHVFDKVSEKRFAEILDIKANEIQRSVDFLLSAQNTDSPAIYCPALRDVIKPLAGKLAQKGRTVYSYY